MDFENINLEKIIVKGKIPDNDIYNKKKIISGAFGAIYLHSKKDDEDEESEYIIEKKFLQTKNDLMFCDSQIFISFIKELFIQKMLNKYLEENITTNILGYKIHYEYIDNVSMNEKLSITSNYIENDLRDISGESIIRENFIIIVKKLLNILSKLHSLGITHLDIKPGNFLIDDNLNIFAIDFGISRINNNHFNCKENCKQKLYTQPYRSFNNIKYIQKYKCNKICNHSCDLNREDLFALGPMLYEMWHGVDEYFLDIEEDAKEKKKHYEYFENKKFIKKYKKFVDKVCKYLLENNQCNDEELNEFKQLMLVLVNNIPGNNIEKSIENKILKNYGYEVYQFPVYNSTELEFIDLLKYDDLKSKYFNKNFESRKHYAYQLLNKFTELDL